MSKRYIVLDFESYYTKEYSLSRMTPPEYIVNPLFQSFGASVCIGDDGVPTYLEHDRLVQFFAKLKASGQKIAIVSHNAMFDMCVLSWQYDYRPALMIDTLGMARTLLGHKLMRLGLAAVAKHLGLPEKGGFLAKTMGMFPHEMKAAGMWKGFVDYANHDAYLCREIFKILRKDFPAGEYEVMHQVIDCAVTPRFIIDEFALAEHKHNLEQEKEQLLSDCGMADRSELMSNDKYAAALLKLGVEPAYKTSLTTQKQTYAFAKTDEFMVELSDHPDSRVQALHAARVGHKSTQEETRTERFINIARIDASTAAGYPQGSFPFPLRYGAAHTHRLGGDWKLNGQNLPRQFKRPGQPDQPGKLRKSLMAPKGYKVVTVDASQIEARVNAYISGQWDLIEAFRLGRDVYSEFAGDEIYHRPITKADKAERFIGKTCLAEGTLVYTDAGLMPIEQVSTTHRVWDGVEWVCHLGPVLNGLHKTVSISGISLTPDHLVLCETQWKEAQFLVLDAHTHSQALDTGAAALSSLVTSGVTEEACPALLSSVTAGEMSILSRGTASKTSGVHDAISVPRRQLGRSDTGNTTKPCHSRSIGHGSSIASQLPSLGAIAPLTEPTNTMGYAVSMYTPNGEQIARRSFGTFRLSPAGISPSWRWTVKILMGTTNRVTSALLPGRVTSLTKGRLPISKQRSRVYDLLSAGPRHRFMVHTDDGPMIMHNCILGLGYQMGAPKFQASVRISSRTQLGVQIDIPLTDCTNIVAAYRRRFSKIAGSWQTLKDLIPLLASHDSGAMFGPIRFGHQEITGPGGLKLYYKRLHNEFIDGQWQWLFTYGGKTKRLYGGKLLENIVQFLSRLHIMDVGKRVRRLTGFSYAAQVHDELIYVVPESEVPALGNVLGIEMVRPMEWAPNIPLGFDLGVGDNYGEAK